MSSEVVASSLNLDEQQPASSHTVQADSVQSAHAQKVNLLGMSRPQLEKFFEEMGEKKFRAGQVMKWIHQFFVTDFAEMTNISGKLREKLERICEIKAPEVVHRNYSKDGTRKWVFRVGDGAGSLVETVLIPAEDKTGHVKPYVFLHKSAVRLTVHSVQPVSRVFSVIYCQMKSLGNCGWRTILIWKMCQSQSANVL